VTQPVPLYDAFEDYDRFVNWPARLAFELPFLRRIFQEHAVRTILDVACGTGQHAIALAKEGYGVTGTDLSQAMVERARRNAQEAGVTVAFYPLGFGELAQALPGPFDALICLGNSLPHVTDLPALERALRDMAAVLRPGGVLIIQNRNFDRVLALQERFMDPQVAQEGEQEWVFFRFYDFAGELLRFNLVRLHRQGQAPWTARVEQTLLRAWRHAELEALLRATGLAPVTAYGSYRGEPYAPQTSGDLILVAQRSGPQK